MRGGIWLIHSGFSVQTGMYHPCSTWDLSFNQFQEKWIIDLRQDVGNTHAIFHLTSSNRLSIYVLFFIDAFALCASGLWRNYSIEAGFLQIDALVVGIATKVKMMSNLSTWLGF